MATEKAAASCTHSIRFASEGASVPRASVWSACSLLPLSGGFASRMNKSLFLIRYDQCMDTVIHYPWSLFFQTMPVPAIKLVLQRKTKKSLFLPAAGRFSSTHDFRDLFGLCQ